MYKELKAVADALQNDADAQCVYLETIKDISADWVKLEYDKIYKRQYYEYWNEVAKLDIYLLEYKMPQWRYDELMAELKCPIPFISGEINFPPNYQWALDTLGQLMKRASHPNPVSNLPKELTTPEAQKYFNKAVDADVMEITPSGYKWKKSIRLLCCFTREMSLKLHLGKGMDGDRERVSWKEMEELFNIPRGKLRESYNDLQRTGVNPKGIEIIERIFVV